MGVAHGGAQVLHVPHTVVGEVGQAGVAQLVGGQLDALELTVKAIQAGEHRPGLGPPQDLEAIRRRLEPLDLFHELVHGDLAHHLVQGQHARLEVSDEIGAQGVEGVHVVLLHRAAHRPQGVEEAHQ